MTHSNFATYQSGHVLEDIVSAMKTTVDKPFVINKIPLREFIGLYGRVDVVQNASLSDNGNILSIERTIYVSPAFLFRLGLDFEAAMEEIVNVIHLVNQMGLSSYPVLSENPSISERLFRRDML